MRNLLLTLFMCGFLSGCNNNEVGGKSTQVVARVNGDEITVHQINGELRRVQVPANNPNIVAKKILTSLIDRQLLLQEAIKLNLDRRPDVMQLVDSNRDQIYAQAYLARKISTLSPATEQEIKSFMREHSEVFNHRKVFSTTDIIFANDPNKVKYAELQMLVNNPEDLKSWLNTHDVKFEVAEENIPTEALPKESAALASQIKIGDLLFMHDDIKVVIRSVTSINDAPLLEEQAYAMATKAVNERKRQQLILDEIQRLKKLAKIDVVDSNLKSDSGTMSTSTASSPALSKNPSDTL